MRAQRNRAGDFFGAGGAEHALRLAAELLAPVDGVGRRVLRRSEHVLVADQVRERGAQAGMHVKEALNKPRGCALRPERGVG